LFTTSNKRAIVSVINDLVSDARVNKTCMVLGEAGYSVTLIGRKLPDSPSLPVWPFKAKRMHLFFTKGVAFYFFFNLRLLLYLLFTKRADLYLANDLDTLWPNYLVAKIKRAKLLYDSHELFCEVPELQHRKFKRKIWQALEKRIVPKLSYSLTVSDSIAGYFKEKYGTHFLVLRNIPELKTTEQVKTKKELGIPENKRLIILQGAGINIQRGAEELLEAMTMVDDAVLYIIGSGDVWSELQRRSKQSDLKDKVVMIPKIPRAELLQYTRLADLGISIDTPGNLNYLYSLPNKLFDYIHCEVPILASRLVEIEKIVKNYGIGDFIESHRPAEISGKINEMLRSPDRNKWKKNLLEAKKVLNWETEKKVLVNLLKTMNE